MGHSSIKVTFDTYGHLFPGRGKEASARYEKSMADARVRHKTEASVSNPLAMMGKKAGKNWLRGVDLNHRPLGYEAIDLLLSSLIYGTSGIVRNRKEASGERFGS
jgi:hypothetical protein